MTTVDTKTNNPTFTQLKVWMTQLQLTVCDWEEERDDLIQKVVEFQAAADDVDMSCIARAQMGNCVAAMLKSLGVDEEETC